MRIAVETDRQALVLMLERCSAETRVHRFGGFLHAWPEPFLTDCLASPPEKHDAIVLLAPGPDGPVSAGLASAALLETDPAGDRADISLLIEDAWQHRGLAELLLSTLVARAWERGVRRLSFQVMGEQGWLARWASRHVRVTHTQFERDVIFVEAVLEPPQGP